MSEKKMKIGLVVQRGGLDLVGGSEEYAYQVGLALSEEFEVELITSCAQDYFSWANSYRKGVEEIKDNYIYRRFEVDFERGSYWTNLHGILNKVATINDFIQSAEDHKIVLREKIGSLPSGYAEEFIKYQGPYSTTLLEFLDQEQDQFDLLIFFTYLYPTTYFGIQQINDRRKVLLVPTFHDEPFAHFGIMQLYRGFHHLFLTEEEMLLAEKVIYRSDISKDIIGFGLEEKSIVSEEEDDKPYFIYAGRLESSKSVDSLYRLFENFHAKHPEFSLYTIGKGPLSDYKSPCIQYKGFVDDDTKMKLMHNAIALIHPSALESLGIVIMESFMVKTPVVVNKKSKVLCEHVTKSQAGLTYDDQQEFDNALLSMANPSYNEKLADKGYVYFKNNFSRPAYREKLISIVRKRIAHVK